MYPINYVTTAFTGVITTLLFAGSAIPIDEPLIALTERTTTGLIDRVGDTLTRRDYANTSTGCGGGDSGDCFIGDTFTTT